MPALQSIEVETLKEAFNTGGGDGYVLDFSDRTMRDYFHEEFRLDLGQPKYCVNGTSKGKRLLTFLALEDGTIGARILHSLWKRRSRILLERHEDNSDELHNRYCAIAARFQGRAHPVNVTGFKSAAVPDSTPYNPPPAAGWRNTTPQPPKEWAPPVPPLSSKDLLKQSFTSLFPMPPQMRGFAFEKFLGEMFEAYSLVPRSSFRLTGEQIDGSMTFKDQFYLLEAKWQNGRTGLADLLTFDGKVAGKSRWTRGLFISYAGYSDDGLEAFARGRATNIICMDGYDIHEIVSRPLDLGEVIGLKLRLAAETSRAFVGVRELYS